MISKRLTAVVLGCALAAAGCGDDDDSGDDRAATATAPATATTETPPAETSPTKAAYIRRADATCARSNTAIERRSVRFFQGRQGRPSRRQLLRFAENVVLPGLRRQIDQLRALPAPPGDADEVDAIYDAADEALEELEADPAKLIERDDDSFAEANRRANDYGLKVCGSG